MKRYFHIDLLYCCYGIIIKDNVVIDAAPIAKWMIGKQTFIVRQWLINKGAKITELNPYRSE